MFPLAESRRCVVLAVIDHGHSLAVVDGIECEMVQQHLVLYGVNSDAQHVGLECQGVFDHLLHAFDDVGISHIKEMDRPDMLGTAGEGATHCQWCKFTTGVKRLGRPHGEELCEALLKTLCVVAGIVEVVGRGHGRHGDLLELDVGGPGVAHGRLQFLALGREEKETAVGVLSPEDEAEFAAFVEVGDAPVVDVDDSYKAEFTEPIERDAPVEQQGEWGDNYGVLKLVGGGYLAEGHYPFGHDGGDTVSNHVEGVAELEMVGDVERHEHILAAILDSGEERFKAREHRDQIFRQYYLVTLSQHIDGRVGNGTVTARQRRRVAAPGYGVVVEVVDIQLPQFLHAVVLDCALSDR